MFVLIITDILSFVNSKVTIYLIYLDILSFLYLTSMIYCITRGSYIMVDVSYKRLKKLRKEKGDTQAEIAEALGVNAKTISRWESGKTELKKVHIQALAEYFGVNIGYLLGVDDEPFMPLEKFLKSTDGIGVDKDGITLLDKEDVRKSDERITELAFLVKEINEKVNNLSYEDVRLIHELTSRLSDK